MEKKKLVKKLVWEFLNGKKIFEWKKKLVEKFSMGIFEW
jgi:hypothetical protein